MNEESTPLKFYIGLDFSIDKPAMTIKSFEDEYYFFIFPLEISPTLEELYKGADVNCYNRKLSSISKKEFTSSELVNINTQRAYNLAHQIYETIINCVITLAGEKQPCELYLCSEGLSFQSRGNAALDLATYKAILLATLYHHFYIKNENPLITLKNVFTYSPITIKSIAGCATKENRGDKNAMIKAFMNENTCTQFQEMLIEGDFTAKKNYKKCVDDIVDSYWAVQTMIKKDVRNSN